MARLKRTSPVGVPVHILLKSNNLQKCFNASVDYAAFLWWLREYSEKYNVDVHAWVLLENQVHLLSTPNVEGAISNMIQAVGRQYVRFFNYQNQRTGTLWEGRFRSCLIQPNHYLLELYRYIEMKPVRLSIVSDAGNYAWSSFQVNAKGNTSALCKPHMEYFKLGATNENREAKYFEYCEQTTSKELLKKIENNTNKGLAIGEDNYIFQLEQSTGRRLTPIKRGRPVGWRKKL